ncbi:MAG: DUF951 domain-containing protein [Chloroflexi bacterium]|nr:MAG: DUF951 domain-containing protein [Chloroflexota bacterium]
MEHELAIGDRVEMRKKHPCGSHEWIVYRLGADIGMRCAGCDRRVMLPRQTFFKRLKRIIAADETSTTNEIAE